MQKLSVWAITICLVALIVMVTGCQCGTSTTTSAPPSTTAPSSTTPADTAPSPTPPSPSTSTPAETTLYESTEHGFSIEYPREWVADTYPAATNFRLQVSESGGSLSMSLSVDYALGEADLDEVVAQGKEYMAAMPQFELFSEGYITLDGGLSAYEMIGQGYEGPGVLQKYRYIALVREKQVFWLGVSGEPDAFDAQRQLVDIIIDSFKLLPSYTFEPEPVGPGGTFTDAEYGFSITCPAGWDDYTIGQHGEILDLRADAGIPEVMVRAWQETTTIQGVASTLQQVYSDFADYELLSEGETTLADGTPAYQFIFNATMEGHFLTCKCVTVVRGTDVFSIMGLAPPTFFTQNEAVLDEIIRSFHLE